MACQIHSLGILVGFFTGMAQWRSVFRERFSQSGLWVVANSLGWGLGWLGGTLVILKALGSDMPNGVVMVIGSVVGLGVLAGLLVGAVIGAVTGLALIRMFKHPLPPAPIEQTTPDLSHSIT